MTKEKNTTGTTTMMNPGAGIRKIFIRQSSIAQYNPTMF